MTFNNKAERDKLIDKMLPVYLKSVEKGSTYDLRLKNGIKYDKLRQKYLDKLPLVNLNVCPFCGHVNKAKLDPWGIDGPFWASAYVGNRLGYEPDCCEHLFYYSGGLRYSIIDPTLSPERTHARFTMQNKFSKASLPHTSSFPFINGNEKNAKDNPEFVVGEVRINGGHTLYPVGCYTNPGRKSGFPFGKWFSDTVTKIGEGSWEANTYHIDHSIRGLINKKRVHWTKAVDDNTILYTSTFKDYPHHYPSKEYLKDPRAGERTPL
jgi:hypothetical protein